MSDAPKDPPLVAPPNAPIYGASVIELAAVRIQRGETDRLSSRPCEHKSLVYSRSERRVWCSDCERTIDGFDAFLTLTLHFDSMVSAAKSKLARADQALRDTVGRRAAKLIDRAWSGRPMAVSCPHCRVGLLPEDFEHGLSKFSAEFERARRSKAKDTKS